MKMRRIISVALLTMLATMTAAVGVADPAKPTDQNANPLGNFGACMSAEKHGQMIILMDQSDSLLYSDPDRQREVAASYLIDQLASYTQTSGSTIDLQVAGFAADYYGGDWAPITPDNADIFKNQISDITNNVLPVDTDYVMAVDGARMALAENSGDYARECQAVAWFSDGEFFISPRTTSQWQSEYGVSKPYAPGVEITSEAAAQQVLALGTDELCRGGGTMDQLRANGVTVLGFGLTANAPDMTLFNSAVTAESCGQISEPPGVIFNTADPADLLLAFDAISHPDAAPQQFRLATCQDNYCAEGALEFTLDDGISSVEVLVKSQDHSAVPMVAMPDGTIALLEDSGQGELTQVSNGAYKWVVTKQDATQWAGVWGLAMISDSANAAESYSDFSIVIRSSLETEWPDDFESMVRAGEVLDGVTLTLIDASTGVEINPEELLGEISVDAKIIDATGQEFEIFVDADAQTLSNPVSIDLTNAAPGVAVVVTNTTITTAGAERADGTPVPGTELFPRASRKEFTLAPSAVFPTLPGTLSFGTLDGVTQASATMPIEGSGCVWLAGSEFTTGPTEVSSVTVSSEYTSADSCLMVDDDADMPLDIEVNATGNGSLNGVLTFTVAPADELTRTVDVKVNYNAEMVKPLNVETVVTTAIIAALLGILIPLLVLYVTKFATTKIPNGTYRYFWQEVPLDDPTALTLPVESEIMTARGGGKEMTVGHGTLKAKVAWAPTSHPYVLLEGVNSPSIGSHTMRSKQGVAVLPQNVASAWALVPSSVTTVNVLVVLDGSTRTGARESWAQAVADAQDGIRNYASQLVPDQLAPNQPVPNQLTPDRSQAPSTGPSAPASFDEKPSSFGENSPFGGNSPFGHSPFSTGSDDPFGGSASSNS
ncbi:MAG: hypothetical protein GX483_01065 [Actinomycetaceae bacterium]|nr:hypothetical protein [Actinomycetaceae bacterium]